MQSQKPTTGTKATGSNPNGKQDDVMVFAAERFDQRQCSLSKLGVRIDGLDQGRLVSMTIQMLDQGRRSEDPQIQFAVREEADTTAAKDFDAAYVHAYSQKGQAVDILSALWINSNLVVITGTRELIAFASDKSNAFAHGQMIDFARALAGIRNRRKDTASTRLFLAGANINPVKASKGDIVSVAVNIADESIAILTSERGGLVAVDIDPVRKVFYALRAGTDGNYKELVETSVSALQVMPELLTSPADPADWRVIVTAPKGRPFYYATRSSRIDDHRAVIATLVGGYTVTVTLDGNQRTIKDEELMFTGPKTPIGRFHTLNGNGMGIVFIQFTSHATAPTTHFQGGADKIHHAFRSIVGQGRSASAPA